MKHLLWILPVLMLASVAVGQEAELVIQLEAEKKKLQADRDDLRKQLGEIREKISEQADVAALRKAYEDAEAAYRKDEKENPAITDARQAEKDASKAYRDASDAAAAKDPGVKALQDQMDKASKTVAESDKQRHEIDKALFQVRRKLYKAEAVKALQAEADRESKAVRDLRDKDPDLAEQRDAMEAARKAYDQARRAFDKAVRDNPRVKEAEARQQAARKAVDAKVNELLATDPEAAPLLEKRKAAEQARDEARKTTGGMWKKVFDARRAAVNKDPDAAAARKAYDASRQTYHQTRQKATETTRKARDDARNSCDARVREMLTADPQGVDLETRLKAVDKRYNELRNRIRDLQKKQQADKPKDTEG